ncbi:RBM7 protein, partial [Urocolius indicus]|nr:RBM7 protein [Urocolius indicus]
MGAAAAEADRTLFVGNLDPKVTEELIFELFHQAGPVIKVKIPKDREGRAKQFAFVSFKHEESVPYGLSLLNGIKLYGRPINIQFRSGSSHASQDGHPSCSPHGPGAAGAPHPAANCSRYGSRQHTACGHSGKQPAPCSLCPCLSFPARFGASSALRQPPPPLPPPFGFAAAGPPHAAFAPPALRKGRLAAHPYHTDGRHFSREQRFGPDYGRGRDEPAYDDRHRDGWSHDYRREGYREPKWHPSRH